MIRIEPFLHTDAQGCRVVGLVETVLDRLRGH
jgi:hypothetical protein